MFKRKEFRPNNENHEQMSDKDRALLQDYREEKQAEKKYDRQSKEYHEAKLKEISEEEKQHSKELEKIRKRDKAKE